MKRSLFLAALLAATGLAGAASAQTLPGRDDPAWESLGMERATHYYVLPSSIERTGDIVWVLVRATVPPMNDQPDTIIAHLKVDCMAKATGARVADLWSVTGGFLRTTDVSDAPTMIPATDPGQSRVIARVCGG